MPLYLQGPSEKRGPNYRIRGTYLGIRVERSARTSARKVAQKELNRIKAEIECGRYAAPGAATFASAAVAYMKQGGDRRFMEPLLLHLGSLPLEAVNQTAIDAAALALYPNAKPATRNRQVYSPVQAVLRHAGKREPLRRPKGSRGTPRRDFLAPEQAFALLEAATKRNRRFGALCTFLLYTGTRLSEALSLRPENLDLSRASAWIPKTKNGEPRNAHLPLVVIAALSGLDLTGRTVFGNTVKSRRVYRLLEDAEHMSGVEIPEGVAFHIFRHSYGAWMRRYGGLDTSGLVATGAWKDRRAAAVYEHVDASEEAKKADLLPTRAISGQKSKANG